MFSKKIFFYTSLVIFIALYLLIDVTNFGWFNDFRIYNESSIVDPVSYISLFALGIATFFLFFPDRIFKLWLRRIAIWFLPLSIFLIWGGGGGNEYASLGRTDTTIALGVVLVFITAIFTLTQRFYYKLN